MIIKARGFLRNKNYQAFFVLCEAILKLNCDGPRRWPYFIHADDTYLHLDLYKSRFAFMLQHFIYGSSQTSKNSLEHFYTLKFYRRVFQVLNFFWGIRNFSFYISFPFHNVFLWDVLLTVEHYIYPERFLQLILNGMWTGHKITPVSWAIDRTNRSDCLKDK